MNDMNCIDLSNMTEETESEMDRLCACAMAALASRLEDGAEHLVGRARDEAAAEAHAAWETAEEYWSRAVLMSETELLAEAIESFDGLPSGSPEGDLDDLDGHESFFEADTLVSARR